MRRVGWRVLIAVGLCAVAAALWWRFGDERAQRANAGDSTRSLPVPAAIEGAPVERQESAPAESQDAPPPVEREDYAAQLRAASDYLEFARSLLPAARAGDHAAQFNIFRALDYCAIDYRFYVDRGATHRTLDDALKWAASHWPYDYERVRLVYDRCHTLMESQGKDLGERGEWLRLASDGGYPLAQVMAAKRQQLKGVGTGDDAAKNKESRRLASMAIRTRDPQVIWEIADSQLTSGAQGEADSDELAWFLAACQRGFDCSPQSDSVSAFCRYDPNCQPYESVADLFRRARGDDFPELEARARWISEKVDAGDWEALGF
jgi:hypothetical protein